MSATATVVRTGRATYIEQVTSPPLRALRVGGKIAISVERPGEFLIRAWTVSYSQPQRILDWILHYIGRRDFEGLVWWGMTYPGQPRYMTSGEDRYTSGLTIQKAVMPNDRYMREAIESGRHPSMYAPPEDLEIPERGVLQIWHEP